MSKITIEDKYGKYTLEDVRDDLNIYEMIELIERGLLAMSFSQATINEVLNKEE